MQGAIYGVEEMPLIEAGKSRHLKVGGDDNDLAQLLVRGRVHYTLINPVQVEYLQHTMDGGENLVGLVPEGMSPSQPSYIICSQSLPRAWRDRINAAIGDVEAP